MTDGTILMLTNDPATLRIIIEGVARLSTRTHIAHTHSLAEVAALAKAAPANALILDAEFGPVEEDFVHDFQTAFPTVPILLVADSPQMSAPLVSGSPMVQFLRKPIQIRELQPALVSILYPNGIHVQRRLEAYLSGLLLADVVQLMLNTGMSAHLLISSSNGETGDIEIRNGSVVASAFAGLIGAPAFIAMLAIAEGQIVQHPPRANVDQNLFMPTDRLLIQAASMMDEAQHEKSNATLTERRELDLRTLEENFRDTPKLLVIEDNSFLLSYLESLLSEAFAGVVVIGVPKGSDGLACVNAAPPHAIVLDRHLADMKGEEFCAKLRGIPGCEDTPVILISGDLPPMNERAKNFPGATWFLEKPFQAARLVEVLAEMLGVPLDSDLSGQPG